MEQFSPKPVVPRPSVRPNVPRGGPSVKGTPLPELPKQPGKCFHDRIIIGSIYNNICGEESWDEEHENSKFRNKN